MLYGKPLVLRRETCNFGDDYDYNPNAKPAIEWVGPVLELKNRLEAITGRVFTQCACNLYPDGATGIGLHHDKRHPLTIASFSFGAVRTVGFAPKGGKLDKTLPTISLASGSLVLFTDEVNENYKHTIIEDKAVNQPRISVTFREFAAEKQPKTARGSASVAVQQKSQVQGCAPASAMVLQIVDYDNHTNDELHEATVAALAAYKEKQGETDRFAYEALIPALEQIIARYKQPGRGKPYRLNGCSTVTAYFDNIGLNYATVRSWKSRAQQRLLRTAVDAGTKPVPHHKRDAVPHLNTTARKSLIEGNHKAVEIVKAIEAGRDGRKEITEFKVVMGAKRLDDMLSQHDTEPDYKDILTKLLHVVQEMKSELPNRFLEIVDELVKTAKLRAETAADPGRSTAKLEPAGYKEKGDRMSKKHAQTA